MVEYPDNDLTRMIEALRSGNLAGSHGGGVASASPLPTVRSADLGRMTPDPPPLTFEEQEALDQQARAAGMSDHRLPEGVIAGSEGYATMEDALAAGSPIERVAQVRIESRQTAREFLRRSSRLPDFRNVEGIDLVKCEVLLDGMTFPIAGDDVVKFKQFVVETAHAAIMNSLKEAMSLLTPAPTLEEADAQPEGDSEV